MAIVFTDWLNRNENRNYPLHDSASKEAISGRLPDDILADAHIMVPRSAGRYVFVSSVALTPALASVTFLATDEDPFSGSSTSSQPFLPLAAITVQRPVVPYKNYPISAIYPGVGGWIAFGNGVNERSLLSLQFDNPAATLLVSRAAGSYDDLPVTSLSRLNQSLKLKGLVLLRGEAGLIRVRKALRTIEGVKREVAVIGLDLDAAADPIELLHRFTGPCGNRPEERTCPSKALVSINGVPPDCHGNLRIRVVGLDATIVGVEATGYEGDIIASGNVIDVPVSLDDVCAELDRLDPEDLCVSSSSSSSVSSSSVSSSSSSPSPEPSSSSAAGGYCDSFDDPLFTFANLFPKQGSWSVRRASYQEGNIYWLSNRLFSGRGTSKPQVITHDKRYLSADDGYRIEAVLRPATERGNGHVIFGYKSIDDFWFAGASMDYIGDVPGALYVGRKTAHRATSLDNWPEGLDFGYKFLHAGPPSTDFGPGTSPPPLGAGGLFYTDIKVIVEVQPISPTSSIKLVQVKFVWDESVIGVPTEEPIASIIFTVSPSDSDMYGFAGLGSVGSETAFDDLGIECAEPYTPPSSSSETTA